jgi:hypothetical protein
MIDLADKELVRSSLTWLVFSSNDNVAGVAKQTPESTHPDRRFYAPYFVSWAIATNEASTYSNLRDDKDSNEGSDSPYREASKAPS